MKKTLVLTIEVSGCPLSCMHCWSRASHYAAMPLMDVAWVLERAQQFCSAEGLSLAAYPMHEILTHPEVGGILQLFEEFALSDDHSEGPFEPIATDGIPLAIREDWPDILEAARTVGTNTFWFALHGIGETHNRIVNRKRAYDELRLAIKRVRAAGFRCGCNVFLTKENIPQFPQMVEALQTMGMDETSWEIAIYSPTVRGRLYEELRPELEEIASLADTIREMSLFYRDKWANLDACTEAAYYQKTLRGEGEEQDWSFPASDDYVNLVCRSNFDLHSGKAGIYGPRHGNLREDDMRQVFEKAVECGVVPDEALYFSTNLIPSVSELARQFGDPIGHKIYFLAPDMRRCWLDRALVSYRKY